MGFQGNARARAGVAVGAAALAALSAAACSGGGGGSAASRTVEGVNASACAALSAQVSKYRVTDPSSGVNLNAGALRHSPKDTWTVSGPVRIDGADPIDVVPWLKLSTPGSSPAECESPVTAQYAGKKPDTEALLFPASAGVQANLEKQFEDDVNNPHFSLNGADNGEVSNGALQATSLTSPGSSQNQYGNVDVDILTTFHHGNRSYVVIYRDPVIVAISQEAPNSAPNGNTPAPSADRTPVTTGP